MSGPVKKGSRKRKKTHFQPGNSLWRTKREETQEEVITRIDDTPVLDAVVKDAEIEAGRLLHPQALSQPEITNSMRLVHFAKTIEMFMWAFKHHPHSSCKDFDLDLGQETRKGVVVAISLKCLNCNFQTQQFKLYDEVDEPNKRGPKTAVLNKAYQAALMHTAIGQQKGRLLLNALDIPVPSETGMSKLAAQVSETLADLADEGMKEKAERVKTKNNTIHVSADARYNTTRIGSSRRTGLSLTSQSHTLVIENESGLSYVVGQMTQSKICPIGTALMLKGENIQCPGHKGCTATINRFDSLTERAAGQQIARDLAKSGIIITQVTTDGDGKFHLGVQDVTPTVVERLADTTHLAQTLLRKAKSTDWSDRMFSGVKTKTAKGLCATNLAHDIKNRSVAVLKELHKKHRGDINAIKKESVKVINAIIVCYQGDCKSCKKLTTACAGGESGNNWMTNSSLLQEYRIQCLQTTKGDVKLMKGILGLMLGKEALEKTKLLSNTQQNEAVNRSISVSLPKNTKFSRVLRGRLGCVLEVCNQGIGEAMARQWRALKLPITRGQGTFLRRQQRKSRWKKIYNRAESTRMQMRKRCTYMRLAKRKHHPKAAPDYCKHQLDDHNYHQVSSFFIIHFMQLMCV